MIKVEFTDDEENFLMEIMEDMAPTYASDLRNSVLEVAESSEWSVEFVDRVTKSIHDKLGKG